MTLEREAMLALLRRIRAWDMMDVGVIIGAHWKREIDAAIAKVEGRT